MAETPGILDRAFSDFGAAVQQLGVIDSICLGLVAVFALRGFFRGFVRQVAFLASLFVGILLANLYSEPLAEQLPDLTSSVGATDRLFAAYVAIFLGTLLAAALLAKCLESTLEVLQLRSVDRILGFLLGAGCGVLVVAFLLACGLVFTPRVGPGEEIQRSLEESRSLRWVADGVANLRVALPHPFIAHAEEILERHREHRAASSENAKGPAEAPDADALPTAPLDPHELQDGARSPAASGAALPDRTPPPAPRTNEREPSPRRTPKRETSD